MMKRSLLVKAGLALAPDAFQFVLESEDATRGTSEPNFTYVLKQLICVFS